MTRWREESQESDEFTSIITTHENDTAKTFCSMTFFKITLPPFAHFFFIWTSHIFTRYCVIYNITRIFHARLLLVFSLSLDPSTDRRRDSRSGTLSLDAFTKRKRRARGWRWRRPTRCWYRSSFRRRLEEIRRPAWRRAERRERRRSKTNSRIHRKLPSARKRSKTGSTTGTRCCCSVDIVMDKQNQWKNRSVQPWVHVYSCSVDVVK